MLKTGSPPTRGSSNVGGLPGVAPDRHRGGSGGPAIPIWSGRQRRGALGERMPIPLRLSQGSARSLTAAVLTGELGAQPPFVRRASETQPRTPALQEQTFESAQEVTVCHTPPLLPRQSVSRA